MSPFNLAEYEPVEDRLRAFWEEHPTGRIATALEHVGADGYIVRAEAYRWAEDVHPTATGYAQEAVTERGVNSTSALENCETSAIGRALANMGYAAKGKRPSREEMVKASGASPSSASLPSQRSSQQAAAPEETSTKAPLLFCRQSGCGHESALHPLGLACEGINGSHNDPEGGEYPCRCKEFVPPSGPVQGEGAANPPGGTTGEGVQAPSPTNTSQFSDIRISSETPGMVTDESTPATADDLANAAKHGLTPTKAKALAASLGITVTKPTELTREQLAAVINRYLEVKK